MHDKLVQNDLHYLNGEDIAQRVKEENILEMIMKENSQLIAKSSGIFKMLCNVHQIG